MSSYSDSVKLCRGVKAMQRLQDDSAMDGAKIWSCYWIWLRISKWVRERFPLFLRARLNIFTSGGIVYTSKVFLPKGPLMLGFNKVFYCLKKYCLFELFIIPLDCSSTVASVRRDGIIHVFLHFVLQVGFLLSFLNEVKEDLFHRAQYEAPLMHVKGQSFLFCTVLATYSKLQTHLWCYFAETQKQATTTEQHGLNGT